MQGFLTKYLRLLSQATMVFSLLRIGPNSRGQTVPDPDSGAIAPTHRLFVADDDGSLTPDFFLREMDADFKALPDDPSPHVPADTTGALLNLEAPADPQFHYGPEGQQMTAMQTAGISPSATTSGTSTGPSGASSGGTAGGSAPGYTPTSLAQANSDFGNLSINGVDVGEAWDTVQRLMPPTVSLNASEVPIVDPGDPGYGVAGGYNWSGLLAQSLLFNVVENGFRAASDDQIRRLLANKPFWHDWAASMKQFNMRRWNDGDDFLVNYVGHPMQGAVTGFIEIQNDPVARELEIGANREYWKSRFKAFLWATAYSTHSEISPDGEAGIGNEGGWTYPINCKSPCANWSPVTMKSTNNTGWVDFIITPTVGMLWLLAEDTLDRFVSDRVQGDDRSSLGPYFLRAALSPSRSMANIMRMQSPWYRDRQHDPEIESSLVVREQPSEEQIAELGPPQRFAFAPYFQTMPMGSPADPCVLCFASPGFGTTFDIAITRWLSASFAAQRQGGLLGKGERVDGSTLSVGYGLRFVREGLHSNLSIAVRPGRVVEEIPQPLQLKAGSGIYYRPQEDIWHTSVSLVLSDDLKVTRGFGVRYSVSDLIVRYKNPVEDPPGIGVRPYLSWLSKDEYTNRSNWSAEAGPVLRF